jgi:hypothetical protein
VLSRHQRPARRLVARNSPAAVQCGRNLASKCQRLAVESGALRHPSRLLLLVPTVKNFPKPGMAPTGPVHTLSCGGAWNISLSSSSTVSRSAPSTA